ncbi:hypothetical protein P4E94_19095 [Pontiellaceae bacterium B12219]|nr:hypothetical protein [Pontiellaceae bacterium B12219]
MIGYEQYFFQLHNYVTQITGLQVSSVRPPYPFCHIPPSFDRPLFCTINIISPVKIEDHDITTLKSIHGDQYEVDIAESNITASINTYGDNSDQHIETIVKEVNQLREKGIGFIRNGEIWDFQNFGQPDRRQVDIELHVRVNFEKLTKRLSIKEEKQRVNEFNDKIFNLVMGE